MKISITVKTPKDELLTPDELADLVFSAFSGKKLPKINPGEVGGAGQQGFEVEWKATR